MKTLIQGKNIITEYNVNRKQKQITDCKGNLKTVFTGKPELVKETSIDNWETIYEVDGTIEFNQIPKNIFSFCSSFSYNPSVGTINLTETDEVKIIEKIYRADLNAVVLHLDKVLSEKEFNKEDGEKTVNNQIKEFNKTMIESNDKLLSYCKLHKLNVEETDVDELFKLVYPDRTYDIVDGVINVNEGIYLSSSGIMPYSLYGTITTTDAYAVTTSLKGTTGTIGRISI